MFGLGLTLGALGAGLLVFRATPRLIGHLSPDERLAFARKVSAHATRRKEQR